jgi:membrane associated rhomboid family serine protease
LRELLAAVLERTFGMALEKVEQLSRTLDEIATRGGVKIGALLGGVRAAVAGKSTVWGAIMGAFSALGPGAKAAIIIVLVLALLLLPVTVVLILLLLIAVAIVAIVRTQSAGS